MDSIPTTSSCVLHKTGAEKVKSPSPQWNPQSLGTSSIVRSELSHRTTDSAPRKPGTHAHPGYVCMCHLSRQATSVCTENFRAESRKCRGSWLDVVDGTSVITGVDFMIPGDGPPPRESIGATIPHLRSYVPPLPGHHTTYCLPPDRKRQCCVSHFRRLHAICNAAQPQPIRAS
jgi:hypothetical protein